MLVTYRCGQKLEKAMDSEEFSMMLAEKVGELTEAVRSGDADSTLRLQDWMTAMVTHALIDQDKAAMRALGKHLTLLCNTYNKHQKEGSGNRWFALGEVLNQAEELHSPLRQIELADPSTSSGQLLQDVVINPGLTTSELCMDARAEKSVPEALHQLEQEGLVSYVPVGDKKKWYFTLRDGASVSHLPPFNELKEVAKTVAAKGL